MLNPKDFLKTLSDRWSAKYPADADRIGRGLEIALAGKVAPRTCETWRVVGSERKDGSTPEYLVEVRCGFPSCECKDFTLNKVRCKHIWSAALMTRLAAEVAPESTAAPLPAPKPRRRLLDRGLSALCSKLHKANAKRVSALRV